MQAPVTASPVQHVLMQGPLRQVASAGIGEPGGHGAAKLYSGELKVSLGVSDDRSMPAASTFMYTAHGDGSCAQPGHVKLHGTRTQWFSPVRMSFLAITQCLYICVQQARRRQLCAHAMSGWPDTTAVLGALHPKP